MVAAAGGGSGTTIAGTFAIRGQDVECTGGRSGTEAQAPSVPEYHHSPDS